VFTVRLPLFMCEDSLVDAMALNRARA
jgi:hypothetical protein